MSKMKSDAPTDVNLRDDFATGQATSSQSVQTPSIIQRDELLSQYTRDQDSLELSDTHSSDGKKFESQSKEPQTTDATAIYDPTYHPPWVVSSALMTSLLVAATAFASMAFIDSLYLGDL